MMDVPGCFWCAHDKERRLTGDYQPCPDCAAHMDGGITVIQTIEDPSGKRRPLDLDDGFTVPTGLWVVMNEDALKWVVNTPPAHEDVLGTRRLLVSRDAWHFGGVIEQSAASGALLALLIGAIGGALSAVVYMTAFVGVHALVACG